MKKDASGEASRVKIRFFTLLFPEVAPERNS